MKIRFETTIDDVIAFNRFHFAHSPAWRRQVWMQMLLIPGILCLLFYFWYGTRDGFRDDMYLSGVCLVVVAVAWAVGIRWHMNAALVRNTRKYLAEGSNRVIFGWRELELRNNRLLLKTDLVESNLDLRAIEKIVGNGQYTYVYIGSTSAYMIPMDLYPEDEYREFVAELREAWDNRDVPVRKTDDIDVRITKRTN